MPSELELTIRLFCALVLGGVIGLERERQERAAGLRTVTMVSLGSCLFTLLSLYGFGAFGGSGGPSLRSDPARVAAQIVTGIGFLGAGTIFLRKDLVRGLTTAATIWSTAAIGMASAVGQYYAAFFTTLLILVVLMVLKPIERRLFKRPEEATLSLLMPRRDDSLDLVRAALRPIGAFPQSIQLQEISDTEDRLEMLLAIPPLCPTRDILKQVRTLEGARQILIAQDLSHEHMRVGT